METLVAGLLLVLDDAEIVLNTAIADLKDGLRRRLEEVDARPEGAWFI